MPTELKESICEVEAQVFISPRAAARDADIIIPLPLPPSLKGFDVTVARVDSLRPDMPIQLD